MIPITLFTTTGCHLCELANDLLLQINLSSSLAITYTEIGDDDELVARYGTSIPVVEFADGSQLNWPFTVNDIIAKLRNIH